MRALFRRQDPRPLCDRLPRRRQQFVTPIRRQSDTINNLTQRNGMQIRMGELAEVEGSVEAPIAYLYQRVAGQHLVEFQLNVRIALDGASQQFTDTQES